MAGNLNTALDIGVLGLNAQSRALSVVSDNIANVNTVGYKEVNSQFRSLFQSNDTRRGFQAGGVASVALQDITKQGLIRSDSGYASMAISGSGMFVASPSSNPALEADYVFTRAGAFEPDKDGFLVNTAGYYLQGWPYDLETESLPGTAETRETDFNLLEAVNLSDLNGIADPTENVSFRVNLDAGQQSQAVAPLYENGRAVEFTQVDSTLVQFTDAVSAQTISSAAFSNQAINIGDTLSFSSSALNAGPFTVTAFNPVAGSVTVAEPLVNENLAVQNVITITNPNPTPQGNGVVGAAGATFTTGPDTMIAPDLIGADIDVGDYISVRGPDGARDNNATYLVTGFDPATGTVNLGYSPTVAGSITPVQFDIIKDNNSVFLQDEFATASGSTNFFGSGSSLQSLALVGRSFQAGDQIEIQTNSGLNDGFWTVEEYVASAGILQLRSLDGSQALTTEAVAGNEISLFRHIPARSGLAGVMDTTLTANQVSELRTMAGGGSVPDFSRSLSVFDGQGVEHDLNLSFIKSEEANTWHVELSSLNAFQGEAGSATEYHPDGLIGFGTVKFNSDGTLNETDSTMYVATFAEAGTPPISYTRSSLADAANYQIVWNPDRTGASGTETTGFIAQTIADIDFGATGKADGLSQFAGDSVMYSNTVDGAVFGRFTNVSVDSEGFLSANYDNGLSQKIYKLPLANVPNPGGLQNLTGNAYQASFDSGPVSLSDPANNKGVIQFRNLEQSSVDLATQFTDMIVIQRAYSAASRLVTTADEMLQEATRLK